DPIMTVPWIRRATGLVTPGMVPYCICVLHWFACSMISFSIAEVHLRSNCRCGDFWNNSTVDIVIRSGTSLEAGKCTASEESVMRLFVVCSTVLSIMLAGCTSLPTPPASPLTLSTELPIPAVEPIEMPTPLQQLPDSLNPEGSGVTGEAPVELLAEIQADAAGRTGRETGEIVVIQDQAVVWPDGSLGCPKPGMMYTQALVD